MTDEITLENGKYTLVNDHGKLTALRYGEPWRDCVGDGLMLAMAHEIELLRSTVQAAQIENEQLKAQRNRSGVELRNAVSKAVREEREAWPNLQPVITWLENGCDPKEAAKELRSYDDAIRARSTT